MTNEPHSDPSPDEVSFGPSAQDTGPRDSRARRTGRAATWVAVGAVGATVLTGVAFAASSGDGSSKETPAPAASGAPNGERPGGGHGGPGGRGGLLGGLGGDVLHGEYVVKDGDTTRTMLGQSGEVTAASATALTVKSSDGFTATWSLSSSTKVRGFAASKDAETTTSDVKVGTTVLVVGTRSSATSGAATQVGIKPTAAQLEEFRKNAPQRGDRGPRPDSNTATPAPTSTASSAA